MIARFVKAVSRHKMAIATLLLINLFILTLGYFLRDPATQQSMAEQLDSWETTFTVFGIVRIGLEIYIWWHWRGFTMWCKRFFNLGHRKTWFILQCRPIFKLVLIFDAATFVMLSFF